MASKDFHIVAQKQVSHTHRPATLLVQTASKICIRHHSWNTKVKSVNPKSIIAGVMSPGVGQGGL